MARCEQGYICDVCGQEVEEIVDSDLYLRYVLGEVAVEQLPSMKERHIRCNAATAQFIVDEGFPAVKCEGIFAKELLDSDYVVEQERQVTQAWRRLQDVTGTKIPISDYPLAKREDPVS